jgi:hypothetical protein
MALPNPEEHTILLFNCILKEPRSEMTKRIHGNDLLLVGPLRERPDVCGWLGVGEIGSKSYQLDATKKQSRTMV